MTAPAGKERGARFCSECGERLAPSARFCPGCGQAAGAAPAAAPSWRDQLPGLVVLAFFLLAGLGVWVGVLRPGAPTATAPGRGGPGPGVAGGGAPGGQMPTDHPPVGLPEEAKKFVAQLADKAKAAPQDVAAWKSLAQVQARAAEMDPSYGTQAIESWQHVLTLAPDDGDAIQGIGNVYYDQQKFDLAAAQYEQFLAKHPTDPNDAKSVRQAASVRTDLATAYLYQRQIDKAVSTYQEVITAKPDFLQAHFNLGLAWEAKGEREKALASLDQARGLATDDETRSRIDRVKAQLAATPPGAAAAGIAAGGTAPPPSGTARGPGMPPGAAGGAATTGAPPPTGKDFPSQVEAQLRAHQILGPKIQAIEWPAPDRARVVVADFPMASMPEMARSLFRTRLETILGDAKQRFAVGEPRTIEIADTGGAVMETVTR